MCDMVSYHTRVLWIPVLWHLQPVQKSCNCSPSLHFISCSIKSSSLFFIPVYNFTMFLCATTHNTPVCNLCDIPACHWAPYYCSWLYNVFYNFNSLSLSSYSIISLPTPCPLPLSFISCHNYDTLSLITEDVNSHSLHKLYLQCRLCDSIHFLSARHTPPHQNSDAYNVEEHVFVGLRCSWQPFCPP